MSAVLKFRHETVEIIGYDAIYNDQIAAIALEMHSASMFRDYKMDTDKLIAQLALSGQYPDTMHFRMAVRNGEVFGGFYGVINKMFFSDELMARDVGWWVKQSRRGSFAAIRLLEDFETWAKSKGAQKVMIGQSSGIDIEKTTKLYQHCGYRIIGYNTVKEL